MPRASQAAVTERGQIEIGEVGQGRGRVGGRGEWRGGE